jgi:hypothetical protein
MLYNSKNYLALITLWLLSSCYHKELNYAFDPSYGGVVAGPSCYYLANVREFKMPKGISTFPDGGITKDVRQLFGLFRTDTLTNSTVLISRLGKIVGWPSRYSTRIDKNSSFIAIGIVNVTQADSVSGIYLYSFKSEKLEKYSKKGALPALSKDGLLLAYCINNKLVVDDYSTKTKLFSYLLNFEPVFVLNISTGRTSDSNLRYIKNFDQEIDIQKINKANGGSAEKSKAILDNKYY